MKKFITLIAAIIFETLSISSAMAAEQGFFSLIGGGITPMKDSVSTSISLGLSLGGGFNFNQYVGIEGQFVLLGMATSNTLSAHPIAVMINGYLPIQERLNMFAKVGKSFTTVSSGTADTSVSQSAITNVYGYGIEFPYGEKMKYRFGVDHYDLSVVPGTTLSTNYINVVAIVSY